MVYLYYKVDLCFFHFLLLILIVEARGHDSYENISSVTLFKSINKNREVRNDVN